MMEWEYLDDLCEAIVDCPHSTPKWTNEGYIVLRNQNIRNGRLDLTSPSYTDAENFAHRTKRAKLKADDIVFTREAPMGEVCLIPEGLECCLGQRQVLLRASKAIDSKYLFYAMQSDFVRHQVLWNEGTGSVVSNVRIPLIKKLKIPRFSKEYEKYIADTLSALDEKIELNRRMNATLEAMARALFKSWFVDFDPVRAKMEGRTPGSPEPASCEHSREAGSAAEAIQNLSADIAALFPDTLVDSPLGEIPKDWEVNRLDSITAIQGGFAFKSKDFQDTGAPVIKIKNINADGTVNSLDVDYVPEKVAQKAHRFELNDGDLIMAMTGATVGKFGLLVNHLEEKCLLNQRVARFLPTKFQKPWFIYTALFHEPIINQVINTALGSAQPNISADGIGITKMVVPSAELINAFNQSVSPMFEKIIELRKENQTLSQLRDTLLPKLISGQLRVGDIGDSLKEAV